MRKRYRASDIAVTDDERELAKTAQGAAGQGSAIGSGLGSALGAGLGALGFLVPGLGAVTMPLGASLGGALGGAIGGGAGGAVAEGAEKKLSAGELRRAVIIEKEKARQAALEELLAQR